MQTRGPTRRVLLVDDYRDAADMLAAVIRTSGHEVAVCYDGPSAVDVAMAIHPDVVLLEPAMRSTNGYEVARMLRKQPGVERTPIVAVTTAGQAADLSAARDAGFAALLLKPVDFPQIEQLLCALAPPTSS